MGWFSRFTGLDVTNSFAADLRRERREARAQAHAEAVGNAKRVQNENAACRRRRYVETIEIAQERMRAFMSKGVDDLARAAGKGLNSVTSDFVLTDREARSLGGYRGFAYSTRWCSKRYCQETELTSRSLGAMRRLVMEIAREDAEIIAATQSCLKKGLKLAFVVDRVSHGGQFGYDHWCGVKLVLKC